MAILNFPPGPSHNDTYSANGIDYTYDSDSTSWLVDAAVGYTGSQGFTGSKGSGFTGSRGPLGYTGSQGDIGYTGSQGDIGYTGSSAINGFKYIFDNGTTGTGIPSGNFRVNNGTFGSASIIYISVEDADSENLQTFWTTYDDYGTSSFPGTILIRSSDTSTGEFRVVRLDSRFALNTGTSPNHLEASITPQAGSLTFTDGDEVSIIFLPNQQGSTGFSGSQGDIGYTGSQGDIGYTGSKGDIGFTGSRGDTGFVGSRGNAGANGTGGGFFVLEGERNGSVNLNQYFAIGNGAQPAQGVRVPIDCNLEYLTLSSDGLQTMTVTLYINGSASTATVALAGQGSNTATINPALSITAGDRITFRCTAGSANSTTIASGWFAHDGVKGYTGSRGFTGSKGTDGSSLNITGSVADVNVNPPNNPQTTLNNAFPSAVAGDGAVDQTLGNLWVYDGATWSNVGQFVGYTGSKGDTGFTGSPSTVIGFTGSPSTVIGFTGSKGDTGFTGSKGDTGFTGSKGDTGFTGSRGDTGFVGSRGDTGFTGSKGDTGFTGSKGDTGFVGSPSTVIGFTGSPGTDGTGGINTGKAIAMALIFG